MPLKSTVQKPKFPVLAVVRIPISTNQQVTGTELNSNQKAELQPYKNPFFTVAGGRSAFLNRIEASAGLQPGSLRPGTPASLHATARRTRRPPRHAPADCIPPHRTPHAAPAGLHAATANLHTAPASLHTAPASLHTAPASLHTPLTRFPG